MKCIVSRTSDIFGTKKPCDEAVFYKEIKHKTYVDKYWVVDTTIEEMYKKHGTLVIQESNFREYPIEIEIYDGW